jgi:ceramide glucosyltransferase
MAARLRHPALGSCILSLIAVQSIIMKDLFLSAFLVFNILNCLGFPLKSWLYVRRGFPRKMKRLEGEPDFPVNLIVPCKGSGEHLEDNLRSIANQDYPRLTIRFVTDTRNDPAVPVIEKIIADTGRGLHLVAGFDGLTCGKNNAQLVAIADDPTSEVHLICDSDMRPSPNFVREMVRPYLDPLVNVTSSSHWISPSRPGLASWIYTELVAFSPMFLAFGLIADIWGGCFSIRRRAFEDWDVAQAWRGTEDDDLVLCNKLNEHRQRPVFVPTAVSPSYESHQSIASLVRWLIRQAQTARLHYFPVWLLALVIETLVPLGLLGATAFAALALATEGPTWQAGAALGSIALVMLNGLFVKIPYADRRDFPLPLWLCLPLLGHFIVGYSFLLSINPTMRWGKMRLDFNKDGTIRRIQTLKPEMESERTE